MTFAVDAVAYDRFMGRYSVPLAVRFADFADVARGQRALDVGSGPGALTNELVGRLGSAAVTAVDPSESFVSAVLERHPEVTVRRAGAERLPFEDRAFDVVMAQLVVHFMKDPVAGLRRDGTRHPRKPESWPRACGIWPAITARSGRSGRRRASSTPRSRTSRTSRGSAVAISRSSSRRPDCGRSRVTRWW